MKYGILSLVVLGSISLCMFIIVLLKYMITDLSINLGEYFYFFVKRPSVFQELSETILKSREKIKDRQSLILIFKKTKNVYLNDVFLKMGISVWLSLIFKHSTPKFNLCIWNKSHFWMLLPKISNFSIYKASAASIKVWFWQLQV